VVVASQEDKSLVVDVQNTSTNLGLSTYEHICKLLVTCILMFICNIVVVKVFKPTLQTTTFALCSAGNDFSFPKP